MANEEVLGPRKTMFVLVIVVGCFAVLWPRILSPLLVGHQRDQLQPNQFDRDAGCCDVMFGTELTVLELINEVCSSAVHANGKLSPIAAAECRKAVNETCGVDIAAFVKQTDNIGKSSRLLVQTMQSSNSSCLKEHFGVPLVSLGPHPIINSWMLQDTIKQERPPIRGAGPHPALRERGRAIPPGAPPAGPQVHIQMPPNVRVRNSPLQGYFELDIKPPPIPGMRPPLGSPGGPVPAPKSSMGFVMPIYTICIIVFFVYTISKLFFKRATVPYEPLTPDPQFRRRVFRDDSRSSPDKLVVTAISGLVAEVQQQMEAGYAQNQQRQDVQDNQTRPYTNGTIIHNSGPVHIIASEYRESKDKTPEPEQPTPDKESQSPEPSPEAALEEISDKTEKDKVEIQSADATEDVTEIEDADKHESKVESSEETDKHETKAESTEEKEIIEGNENREESPENLKESSPEEIEPDRKEANNVVDLTEPAEVKKNGDIRRVEDFLKEEVKAAEIENEKTKELLEEAIEEDEESEEDIEKEKSSVKHEAEQVQSIYLQTSIPQQARVLVADFQDRAADPPGAKHSPMVVSGKMTLSLIQDGPRDSPDRDPESTVDDYTTASAVTQPAEKEGSESEEEVEEEIEVEEIEEEVEVEEEEEEEDEEETPVKKTQKGTE